MPDQERDSAATDAFETWWVAWRGERTANQGWYGTVTLVPHPNEPERLSALAAWHAALASVQAEREAAKRLADGLRKDADKENDRLLAEYYAAWMAGQGT